MTDGQFGLFGADPWWLVIGKAVAIFGLLVLLTLFTIWWERRVVSRMQNRVGPNRVGPQGLLQSLMDGFKLALKEEIIPKAAHLGVYWIAPVISATAAFIAFAVIPFGPTVSVFGVETPLQLTDFPVSVLYVLAIASIVARDGQCPTNVWFVSTCDEELGCGGAHRLVSEGFTVDAAIVGEEVGAPGGDAVGADVTPWVGDEVGAPVADAVGAEVTICAAP